MQHDQQALPKTRAYFKYNCGDWEEINAGIQAQSTTRVLNSDYLASYLPNLQIDNNC